jgi:MerR family transcriptional regulator/heat shock protein HspR
MTSPYELNDDMPVYVISVAAELSGMHPQTLRAYDRLGLVSPGRSSGRSRRYSMRDILVLREIQRLSQEEGINLSGIKRILDLERELEQARRIAAELHAELSQLRAELESTRAVAARLAELRRTSPEQSAPGLVPVRSRTTAVAIYQPIAAKDPQVNKGELWRTNLPGRARRLFRSLYDGLPRTATRRSTRCTCWPR